ncbi:MAG TPA: hypothetical protein VG755_28550 [Nannocystaceae bacterium]|nr:hypothetical protein [Nannocystaceae bacterium]
MDIERTRGLTFLLSFAALPMAGCPADDDEATTNVSTESTGNETGNDTNATMSTVGTSVDTSGSAETTMATTNPGTDPSTETSQGETDPTTSSEGTTGVESSSGSSEGTTGAYVDPVCAAYAAKIVECYPKYAEYESYYAAGCTKGLMYYAAYSMECGMAYEDMLACIGMADCADYMAGMACVDEMTMVGSLCGGESTSTSVGSDAGDMGDGG